MYHEKKVVKYYMINFKEVQNFFQLRPIKRHHGSDVDSVVFCSLYVILNKFLTFLQYHQLSTFFFS